MLPSSLAVVLTGLGMGLLALAAFAWGWRRGQYRNLRDQARVIFEPRDERLERSWETPAQRAQREREFGPLIPPAPGEWGGGER